MSRKQDVFAITFVLSGYLAVGVAAGLPESTKAWMRGESMHSIEKGAPMFSIQFDRRYLTVSKKDGSQEINYVEWKGAKRITSVDTAKSGYGTLDTTTEISSSFLRGPIYFLPNPLLHQHQQKEYERLLKQPKVINFLGENGITIDNKLQNQK